MSFDLRSSEHRCGHECVLERYVLDAFDFRTLHYAKTPALNMRAPINGASMTRLFLRSSAVAPDHPTLGWDIVPDPDRVQQNYTFQKIVFRQPLRIVRPLIEVSYITRQGFCLQCSGTGSIRDWEIGASGSLRHIENAPKLAQQCLKYILSSTNPFTPSLASAVRTYVGQKYGVSVTTDTISAEITRVLGLIQQIQAVQKTVQTVTPHELLKDIVSISSRQDTNNPSLIYVSVLVTVYGQQEPVPLNIALQAAG